MKYPILPLILVLAFGIVIGVGIGVNLEEQDKFTRLNNDNASLVDENSNLHQMINLLIQGKVTFREQ